MFSFQGGQNLDEARLREGGEGWTSPGFDDSTLANGTWLWVYNKENNEWTPKWSPAAEVGPGSLHQDSYDGREPREILDDWPSSVVRNERTLHSDAPDLSNSGNSPAGDHQSGSPDPSCRGINRSSKCSASTDEDDESEDGYSAGVSYSDSDGKISEDSGEQEKGSQKGKGKQKNKERERVKDKPLDRSTKQKGTKAVKDVVEPQPPSGAVMRFSDVSLWIIGPSGSVFERFWNGMHWVYIPHTMPNEADSAVSLHYLNHTIIVVSKQGNLYHRLMNDRDRKLLWREWELQSLRPLKWMNHQHPAGVTLAEVVDTGSVQPNLVFAVGTDGELYEYEPPTESSQAKKLRWKHHGRGGGTSASIDSPIAANAASAVRVGKSDGTSLAGCSLFLRMENGRGLYERRFDKGRWRWHVHQDAWLIARYVHQVAATKKQVGSDVDQQPMRLQARMRVWLRHKYDGIFSALYSVYNRSVFAADTEGHVCMRERYGNRLRWRDIGLPPVFNSPKAAKASALEAGQKVKRATKGPDENDKYAGGTVPVIGASATDSLTGNVGGQQPRPPASDDCEYFIGADGALKELSVAAWSLEWRCLGRPEAAPLMAIADSQVLRPRVVFCIGKDGRLYQYNTATQTWTIHESNPSIVLSPLPGTTVRPSAGSTAGSLFLRTESGELVERQWQPHGGGAEGSWQWVEHGLAPTASGILAAAPGPSINDRSVFVVTVDGSACELYRTDEGMWEWIDHGHPIPGDPAGSAAVSEGSENLLSRQKGKASKFQIPLVAPIRGIMLSTQELFFMLQDGRLGLRQWHWLNGTGIGRWEWRVIDTPESGVGDSAMPASEGVVFCTPEPGPFNCVSGQENHDGLPANFMCQA
eukprot:gene4596-5629_t